MIKKKIHELKKGDILSVTEDKKTDYAFLTGVDYENRIVTLEFARETNDYQVDDNFEFDCIGPEMEMVHKRKFSSLLAMAKQSTKNIYVVSVNPEMTKGKEMYVAVKHEGDKVNLCLEQRGKKNDRKRK